MYVVILIDEMKIKESLVYNKHGTMVIGFIDIGDINNWLGQLQSAGLGNGANLVQSIASHMLVLMARGIITKLEYPYAHFPTHCLTSASLFYVVWEGIECLEMLGFKILAITADGASTNCKFLRCILMEAKVLAIYKVTNPFTTEERSIFFRI